MRSHVIPFLFTTFHNDMKEFLNRQGSSEPKLNFNPLRKYYIIFSECKYEENKSEQMEVQFNSRHGRCNAVYNQYKLSWNFQVIHILETI